MAPFCSSNGRTAAGPIQLCSQGNVILLAGLSKVNRNLFRLGPKTYTDTLSPSAFLPAFLAARSSKLSQTSDSTDSRVPCRAFRGRVAFARPPEASLRQRHAAHGARCLSTVPPLPSDHERSDSEEYTRPGHCIRVKVERSQRVAEQRAEGQVQRIPR